jgi:hypothetical protein
MRIRLAITWLVLLACVSSSAMAQRTISADAYEDRLRGMWLGEILGNYAGRAMEGHIAYGSLNYTIPWDAILATAVWDGDDDTCFEYMNLSLLKANPAPTSADIGQHWLTHLPAECFYIANRQARWLMEPGTVGRSGPGGLVPPATGSINRNVQWWAIDSQITTESLGALAPGNRQQAIDLAGKFASVTNDGFAVHAAQYYAAMYAAAAFETDTEVLVQKGLEALPQHSRTRQIISDVVGWYNADKADGNLDWIATQKLIRENYGDGSSNHGRYTIWVESSVNTAMTTMAILYGQGDFLQTINIAVNAGFDADCNPATAAGLIGLMRGYSNLPANIRGATDSYAASSTLRNIPLQATVSGIAHDFRLAAESQILLSGGTITGQGADREYHLGDLDAVLALPDKAETGLRGLVASVLACGGTVRASSSSGHDDSNSDTWNIRGIIDGITDVSFNGHRAFCNDDGVVAQPAGGEWYQISFDRKVFFTKVIFYEGDLRLSGGPNTLPSDSTLYGGFFTNLRAEVLKDGVYQQVGHLKLSEPLDPYKPYQIITLSFDPIEGSAVRIIGLAGGAMQFTTILELEAYGSLAATIPGDATCDGYVDGGDLNMLLANWNKTDASWADGDFTGDGFIDGGDLNILLSNWNRQASTAAAGMANDIAKAKNTTTVTATPRVTASVVQSARPAIQINYQPASVVAPQGYLVDSGLPFSAAGNGYTYGWTTDLSSFAVQQNSAASPDVRYDTAIMLVAGGTWELAVPNGMYDVKVVAGDGGNLSDQKFSVEGVPMMPTRTLTNAATRWLAATVTVVVTDGRLTITAGPGGSICFLQIMGR